MPESSIIRPAKFAPGTLPVIAEKLSGIPSISQNLSSSNTAPNLSQEISAMVTEVLQREGILDGITLKSN